MTGGPASTARSIIAGLSTAGATVATAESVTAGLVAAELTTVPGSSAVVRGGVVAYATDLKESLLQVPGDLLGSVGPVAPEVATRMAEGARRLLRATYGVATTGEAGPDSATGLPVGTVCIAVAGPASGSVATVHLPGGRAQVRAGAVGAALDLLLEHVAGTAAGPTTPGGA